MFVRLFGMGDFGEICLESDAAYEYDVQAAAELITERDGNTRIVVVAGPSSSGKTRTQAPALLNSTGSPISVTNSCANAILKNKNISILLLID